LLFFKKWLKEINCQGYQKLKIALFGINKKIDEKS